MVLKINGNTVPASGPLEFIGEKTGEFSAEMAQWILTKVGEILVSLGKFLVHIGPDVLMILGMVACLGLIIGMKNSGRWAVNSLMAAAVLDIVGRVWQV